MQHAKKSAETCPHLGDKLKIPMKGHYEGIYNKRQGITHYKTVMFIVTALGKSNIKTKFVSANVRLELLCTPTNGL